MILSTLDILALGWILNDTPVNRLAKQELDRQKVAAKEAEAAAKLEKYYTKCQARARKEQAKLEANARNDARRIASIDTRRADPIYAKWENRLDKFLSFWA